MNEKIIQIVLEEMDDGDWTQAKLAKKAGVSQATISRLLNGEEIKLSMLRKIFAALKLPFLLDIYDRKHVLLIKATLETRD